MMVDENAYGNSYRTYLWLKRLGKGKRENILTLLFSRREVKYILHTAN